MKILYRYIFIITMVLCFGCASAQNRIPSDSASETPQEQREAMKSVIGAMSGKTVSDQDLKNLSSDLRKDKEAQSAINAIASPMTQGVQIKYCPVDGKRFNSKFQTCPEHGVSLKDVE